MSQSNWNVRTRGTLAAAVIAAIVVSHSATAGAKDEQGDESKIQQGYRINPVTLDLRGKNRALVGLGSYIVNTGGCNDCHTVPAYSPGHDPFLGQPQQVNAATYLGGGDHFGPFISRNITPDANGLPAGLTRDQFIT